MNGSAATRGYRRRILDDELDELLPHLAAIAIEGPKAVGKTATASRRARTALALDAPATRALLEADPGRLDREPTPILLDEWQRHPRAWDLVRRSVDADPAGGRFLLTVSRLAPTGGGRRGPRANTGLCGAAGGLSGPAR